MFIFFDNCIIDLLANAHVDVIAECKHCGYEISFTPDLKREYEQAENHPNTTEATKELLKSIMNVGHIVGIFGFDGPPFAGIGEGMFIDEAQIEILDSILTKDRGTQKIPKNRTDAHLVVLSDQCIVVTANKNDAHWKKARSNKNIVQWEVLRPLLVNGYGLGQSIRCLLK